MSDEEEKELGTLILPEAPLTGADKSMSASQPASRHAMKGVWLLQDPFGQTEYEMSRT